MIARGSGENPRARSGDSNRIAARVALLLPKMDLPCALVCDDSPLIYVIPRSNDCVFRWNQRPERQLGGGPDAERENRRRMLPNS